MMTKRDHFVAFTEWLDHEGVYVDPYWLRHYDECVADESLMEKVPSIHEFALALASREGYDWDNAYMDAVRFHQEGLKYAREEQMENG